MKNPVLHLNEIQDYELSEKNITKFLKMIESSSLTKNEKKSKKKIYKETFNSDEFLIPHLKDKLFWCFYIIHLGFVKFETIHNFFTEEKQVKISLIENIRSHKDILKKNKWKRNLIENELANEDIISLDTFCCLCTIFNYSFMIIDRQKFYEKIIHDDIMKINIIEKKEQDFGIYMRSEKKNKITMVQKIYWKIDNLSKPLKSISSYKIKDLRDICNKLELDINGKIKKELYQMVLETL